MTFKEQVIEIINKKRCTRSVWTPGEVCTNKQCDMFDSFANKCAYTIKKYNAIIKEIEQLDEPLTMQEVKDYGEKIREENLDVPCPMCCEIAQSIQGCLNCVNWNIDEIKKAVRDE